jgi:hypothetical protein
MTAWLGAGHAAAGGVFWLLLQVPESTVWMLAASLLLALIVIYVVGLVQAVGVLAADPAVRWSFAFRAGARRGAFVVVPLVLFGLVWWLTGLAQDWLARHAGSIDAWLIVKTGITRTAALHASFSYALSFVRYAIGASIALAVMAAYVFGGWRCTVRAGWWRQAFGWKQVAILTLALAPWIWPRLQAAIEWRPRWLPPTWVELAFVGTKLVVVYLAANLFWAVVLSVVASGARARQRAITSS